MTYPETNRDHAWELIEGASKQAGMMPPEDRAPVYAQLAVAHAVMSVHDILVSVRDEIERVNGKLSRPA